jgi:hypothetical protein
MSAARRLALLALLAACASPSIAWSQEWRASARFGRVTYEGAPTGVAAASSVVLGLGRTGPRDWFGGSAALPLGEEPFWAVLGGWRRLETSGAAGLLLDLTGHGFIQRYTATTTGTPAPGPLLGPPQPPTLAKTDLSGAGAGVELMAGGFAGSPSLRLESRAGVAAQRSALGGVLQERALPTADARLSLLFAPVTIRAETRGWADDGATHAYVGGTLQYGRGPLQLWGSLGQWVAGGVSGGVWSAGGSAAIGPQLELQVGGRGNAFDPLYHSSTETSFWAGLSMRVGGARMGRPPVPGRAPDGRAVIRISARSTKGTPSIAGDFTGWKPVPMQRQGSHWTYTTQLDPGVYHYAFVGEDGTWFVPESVPGRQDDGMGGHVAVLVVS